MKFFSAKPVIVAVLSLGGFAWYRAQRPGVMTPELDKLYRRCLSGGVKDSGELRQHADAFERARLFPQAHLLRQRAALRELPDEVKAHRRAIFRKGMSSKNKAAVYRLADAYDDQGCTTAAHRLREYASGLPDLDSRSFAPTAIVTPPPEGDAPPPEGDPGDEQNEPGEPENPGEREKRDTDPAPAEEKPIHATGEVSVNRQSDGDRQASPATNVNGVIHA